MVNGGYTSKTEGKRSPRQRERERESERGKESEKERERERAGKVRERESEPPTKSQRETERATQTGSAHKRKARTMTKFDLSRFRTTAPQWPLLWPSAWLRVEQRKRRETYS